MSRYQSECVYYVYCIHILVYFTFIFLIPFILLMFVLLFLITRTTRYHKSKFNLCLKDKQILFKVIYIGF